MGKSRIFSTSSAILGLVHKLYRGLALEPYQPDEPETTLEKPWMAVVEAFAIGGGCQLLLVVDYVIAEAGAYFNLPARKEGIIPGAANLRLPRFLGEGRARDAIMFDRRFSVESPEAKALVNVVHPPEEPRTPPSREAVQTRWARGW